LRLGSNPNTATLVSLSSHSHEIGALIETSMCLNHKIEYYLYLSKSDGNYLPKNNVVLSQVASLRLQHCFGQ
tara:strand:+ start:341 stop:556 length:216 start_codon:yes stop_codon:yes gene_type:complete